MTGVENPVGRAVVEALAGAGHEVRAFGVAPGADPFRGRAGVSCFAGVVENAGSLEPVASEAQVIVHCANLDEPAGSKDKVAHAVHIAQGTLYTRYAAERELVQRFIHVQPWSPGRAWAKALEQAETYVNGTKVVPTSIVRADPANPTAAVDEIVKLVKQIAPAAATATTATAAH